jgi:hypothetical protein
VDTLGKGTPGEGILGEGNPGEGNPGEGILGEGILGEGILGEGILGEGILGEGNPGEGILGEGSPEAARSDSLGLGVGRAGQKEVPHSSKVNLKDENEPENEFHGCRAGLAAVGGDLMGVGRAGVAGRVVDRLRGQRGQSEDHRPPGRSLAVGPPGLTGTACLGQAGRAGRAAVGRVGRHQVGLPDTGV